MSGNVTITCISDLKPEQEVNLTVNLGELPEKIYTKYLNEIKDETVPHTFQKAMVFTDKESAFDNGSIASNTGRVLETESSLGHYQNKVEDNNFIVFFNNNIPA